ncbi:NAD(P)-dependent oxidoreductase [Lentibacillus sediminis]|uniref:NAD(P)-dependent oxidoreductase n=1 Tax=Lentibacillus sediminis TaxID=1940529 RepID=UPI000C1C5271|nr:NAD(P)H-binding protein [Lentibacillus sediminis]
MNILVLGATGRVGQMTVQRALGDQHSVIAFARTPEKLNLNSPNLTVFQGNVLNQNDISHAMASADIVISALGTDKNNTLSRSIPFILQAMEKHKLSRIITIGTAGILNSRTQDGMFRFESGESKRRTTKSAKDHLAAYQYLKDSNLEWTVVCPTYLPDGEAEGNYRVERNVLPAGGKRISVGDTAAFAYSQCHNKDFIQTRVGIAY